MRGADKEDKARHRIRPNAAGSGNLMIPVSPIPVTTSPGCLRSCWIGRNGRRRIPASGRRMRRALHVRTDRRDARAEYGQARSPIHTAAQACEEIPDRQMNRIKRVGSRTVLGHAGLCSVWAGRWSLSPCTRPEVSESFAFWSSSGRRGRQNESRLHKALDTGGRGAAPVNDRGGAHSGRDRGQA